MSANNVASSFFARSVNILHNSLLETQNLFKKFRFEPNHIVRSKWSSGEVTAILTVSSVIFMVIKLQ